ncbi:MAG: stage II sporulation protein M [Nanoarchaeota archaeon]|nr:stage II sporulation protein M [Nanoarchaeota archaeon]
MVLELLFNPFFIRRKLWQVFATGFVYSLIGLFFSYLVFKEVAGILMVFLIVFALLPMIYLLIKHEEELDLKYTQEIILLKEHTKVLVFFMVLFLGITTALVFAYVFLPEKIVETVFSLQKGAIVNVNNSVQGSITQFTLFTRILMNNLKVLFFCLIFSFLYGTGALFILTWNASVIAAAIGSFIKNELAQATALVGLPALSVYFTSSTLGFLRYMTHGFFEIAAYFVGGLAGGIISIALIKHDLKENRVLLDALDLVIISLGLLIVGSIIEVYVTPLFFS